MAFSCSGQKMVAALILQMHVLGRGRGKEWEQAGVKKSRRLLDPSLKTNKQTKQNKKNLSI